MKLISILAVAAVSAAIFASISAGATGTKHATTGNIVQVAASNSQFSTLVTLVKKAGLVTALSNPKAHLTVFAPTNAAFAALKKADPMTFNAVATTPSLLKKVLTYHVLGTEVKAAAATSAAKSDASVTTLEGEKIALSLKSGSIVLDGNAKVVKANVMASNGVVHVINAVLIPPSVKVTG
jgi:uncharacterized surface protein with fasciclin (FAS1) repeats